MRIGTMKVATRRSVPIPPPYGFPCSPTRPVPTRALTATDPESAPIAERKAQPKPATCLRKPYARPQPPVSLRGFTTAVQPAVAIANTYAGTLMTLRVWPNGR